MTKSMHLKFKYDPAGKMYTTTMTKI